MPSNRCIWLVDGGYSDWRKVASANWRRLIILMLTTLIRTLKRVAPLILHPRDLFRTSAFHITGQRSMREGKGVLPRIFWKIFFGNRVAPRFGRYQNFGAGNIEKTFEELGLTRRSGYFVEAGAYDGVGSSNTKYLELYCGWAGLLIEPDPISASLATYHRTNPLIRAALVPTGFKGSNVELEYSGLMTTTDIGSNSDSALVQANEGEPFLRPFERRHRFSAKAITLSEALSKVGAPTRIDLISLDLEGIELDVLAGFDFGMYDVEYFLIEARSEDEAEAFFERYGYSLQCRIYPVGLLFSKKVLY